MKPRIYERLKDIKRVLVALGMEGLLKEPTHGLTARHHSKYFANIPLRVLAF